MRRTATLAVMLLAAVGVSSGAAAAAVPQTPNGYTGACNMMLDPTMSTTTMDAISDQGHLGMMGAHTASGCTGTA